MGEKTMVGNYTILEHRRVGEVHRHVHAGGHHRQLRDPVYLRGEPARLSLVCSGCGRMSPKNLPQFEVS